MRDVHETLQAAFATVDSGLVPFVEPVVAASVEFFDEPDALTALMIEMGSPSGVIRLNPVAAISVLSAAGYGVATGGGWAACCLAVLASLDALRNVKTSGSRACAAVLWVVFSAEGNRLGREEARVQFENLAVSDGAFDVGEFVESVNKLIEMQCLKQVAADLIVDDAVIIFWR